MSKIIAINDDLRKKFEETKINLPTYTNEELASILGVSKKVEDIAKEARNVLNSKMEDGIIESEFVKIHKTTGKEEEKTEFVKSVSDPVKVIKAISKDNINGLSQETLIAICNDLELKDLVDIKEETKLVKKRDTFIIKTK